MTCYGGNELAAAFRTVRKNTLQIAEDIPEDKYGFTAAPGARSIAQLLTHIAMLSGLQEDMQRTKRVTTLAGYDFVGAIGAMRAAEAEQRGKTQIIGMLRDRGDAFAAWLQGLSADFLCETYTDPTGQNPRTRLEGLLSVKEHEMHHRGQLMLLERMLGIVPHLTRQQEERMAARH
jgi:uncharacterized damage-inducible protein DinB